MISSRDEVEEILKGLGEQLSEPVQFLVIGGAAMLEYALKDVTKDIDLVCRDATGKARLLEAAKSLGFEVFGPEKRHARLGLDRVAIKGGYTLDIFAGRISYDFRLSESMWQRGKKTHHQEARQHACGCPGAAAGENREAVAIDVPAPYHLRTIKQIHKSPPAPDFAAEHFSTPGPPGSLPCAALAPRSLSPLPQPGPNVCQFRSLPAGRPRPSSTTGCTRW
jgi:hypothetical protein